MRYFFVDLFRCPLDGVHTKMVRTANLTPEQLAALLQQAANTTPNPAALAAVGANMNEEELREENLE